MIVQRRVLIALSVFALMLAGIGCADDARPASEAKRDTLQDKSRTTLREMQAKDPDLQSFLDRGHAYAIFPEVGKGGFIVGGAHGDGAVYQNRQMIGWADLKQASVGAQVGGQVFSELIVFENEAAFNKFKNNELSFEANASAVALTAGASKGAVFKNGVAVFTLPQGGAMLEASIGGQRFEYTPTGGSETRTTSEQRSSTEGGTTETRKETEVKTNRY